MAPERQKQEDDTLFILSLREGEAVTMTTLQRVFEILSLPPTPLSDANSISLKDIQIIVEGQVLNLLVLIEDKQMGAKLTLDLQKDLEIFIRFELQEFMKSLSQNLEDLLIETNARLINVFVTREREITSLFPQIAKKLTEHIKPQFPIQTPKLQSLADELRRIMKEELAHIDESFAVYMSRKLSDVTDESGYFLEDSLVIKIHEHPSNRAAFFRFP